MLLLQHNALHDRGGLLYVSQRIHYHTLVYLKLTYICHMCILSEYTAISTTQEHKPDDNVDDSNKFDDNTHNESVEQANTELKTEPIVNSGLMMVMLLVVLMLLILAKIPRMVVVLTVVTVVTLAVLMLSTRITVV
jgi:hypothetical protein